MISAAAFKKQISKTLSVHLRNLGFKGSGFHYTMDSPLFIFTIGVQASQWGGECCAEVGIQPRYVDSNGIPTIDVKKIKYYQCEFRTRLVAGDGIDQWWKYSDDEAENIQIAQQLFDIVVKRVVPIIELFSSEKFVRDQIEVGDLGNIAKNVNDNLYGLSFMANDVRLAWTFTKIYEQRNLEKAKQFAKFGLSKLDKKNPYAKEDFERVLQLTGSLT